MIASYPPRRSFDIHERNGRTKPGQYGFVSSGHHWADFDTYDAEFRETVTANFRQTVWAYVESYENVITEALPDLSKPPGDDFDFRMARLLLHLSYIPRDGG